MPNGSRIPKYESALRAEARRLQHIRERLFKTSTHTSRADAPAEPLLAKPQIEQVNGQLLLKNPPWNPSLSETSLLPDRHVIRLYSLAASPDYTYIALVFRTRDDDQYDLAIVRPSDDRCELIMIEHRVSPTVVRLEDTLLWVRRDVTHRPASVVAWTELDGPQIVYSEPDARFRVSLEAANKDRLLIAIRGHGATEICIFYIDHVNGGFGMTILAERNEQAQFSALFLAEHTVLLDATHQLLYTFTATRKEPCAVPEHFIALRIGVRNGTLCVEGRLGADAAIWLPFHGPSAIWTAPHGGVIKLIDPCAAHPIFAISSLIHPQQMCDADVNGRWLIPPTAFGNLTLHQAFAESDDGAAIPISIYSSTSPQPADQTPLIAIVYGCYGIPLDGMFDPLLASILEAGIAIALCHVRGGGEYGPIWHDAGRGSQKSVSVTDFLTCIQYLRALDCIDGDRIGALASSAGALVAASAVLEQPDFFCAAQFVHPFLTPELLLNDESTPLATTDWIEFGDPRQEGRLDCSPLARTPQAAGRVLPPLWIRVGLSDFRAPLWSVEAWLGQVSTFTDVAAIVQVDEHGHEGQSDPTAARDGNELALAWLVEALTRAETARASPRPARVGQPSSDV